MIRSFSYEILVDMSRFCRVSSSEVILDARKEDGCFLYLLRRVRMWLSACRISGVNHFGCLGEDFTLILGTKETMDSLIIC